MNSKVLHQSSGKEKESSCLLFPSSTGVGGLVEGALGLVGVKSVGRDVENDKVGNDIASKKPLVRLDC